MLSKMHSSSRLHLVHLHDDGLEHGGSHERGVLLPFLSPRSVLVIRDPSDQHVVVLPVAVDALKKVVLVTSYDCLKSGLTSTTESSSES